MNPDTVYRLGAYEVVNPGVGLQPSMCRVRLCIFLPIHGRARGDLQPWAFENISVTQVVFLEFLQEATRAGFCGFE